MFLLLRDRKNGRFAAAGCPVHGLLTELLDANISRFIWLRQFEVGNNSAAANRLLDKLEFLRSL
ncbi:hypothetical protein NLO93_28475, partial [Pseudomonas savastanoi]|uniref:hypothetical protein n=1 Tax=Pseudomonas savastanoi TaxID=29438 RepID=UPI00210C0FB6